MDGDGLITKLKPMTRQRVRCAFVNVWGTLIYVLGGTNDGHCERMDVEAN